MKKNISIVFVVVCLTIILLYACSNKSITETVPATAMETVTLASTEIIETATQATQQPLAEGETIVSSLAELQTALTDAKNTLIHIGSDMDLAGEINLETENTPTILIDKEVTLTITGDVLAVGCTFQNEGSMVIKGIFTRGESNLINNGSLTVASSGKLDSGMSTTDNYGKMTVKADGEMVIEKGTIFNNYGTLINEGSLPVSDGGQLNDMGGTIENNGTIDLSSYFNGDITKITGTGTLNDKRE
jgi:adhesin HecA-like repeat protein